MDGPRDYHTQGSQSERERQISYHIIYMWNLKNYANQPIYKTKTVSWTQRTDLWLLNGKGEEE